MVRNVLIAGTICFLIVLAGLPSAGANGRRATRVESGMVFNIAPRQPISSAGNVQYAQSRVFSTSFKVANEVRSSSGALLIKQDEDVKVQVRTQQARRVGRQGWIEIIPLSTLDAEGNTVPLVQRGTRVDGQRRLGAAIGVGVISFGLGLLIKGRDTSIQLGQEFAVVVE